MAFVPVPKDLNRVKPKVMFNPVSYTHLTVLVECGKMLEKRGYVIKSLNTITFRKSMHYNPFSYIRSEKDILKLCRYSSRQHESRGSRAGAR